MSNLKSLTQKDLNPQPKSQIKSQIPSVNLKSFSPNFKSNPKSPIKSTSESHHMQKNSDETTANHSRQSLHST